MTGTQSIVKTKQHNGRKYIEINLFQLVKTIWSHIIIILLAAAIGGGAGFALAYYVIPAQYQASALLYVNNSSVSLGSTSISLSDLSASQTLVDSYITILKSRLTLDDVIERAQVDYKFEELKKMITAKSVNGTEIFEVTVTSGDPYEAERIANTIVKVLPDKIAQIIDGSSVRAVDLAVVPEKRSSPSYFRFTAMGGLIGLLLSCGIVVLLDLLNEKIRGEEELQDYGLPMLAVIPDLLTDRDRKAYGSYYSKAAERRKQRDHSLRSEEEDKTIGEGLNFGASEAFRLLRTNLLFSLPPSALRNGKNCRVIGITSSMSGEGKSTTALNLGYVLAESGKKVLVVETDLRLPTISRRLKLKRGAGLSSLLAGLCTEQEAVRPSGIQERLEVMSSGPIPPNPTELLGSERMETVMENVAGEYDFIILDLPPVNEVSDALVVSQLIHGMIVVVRQSYATSSSVGKAMQQMENVGVKVLGFVMTYSDSQGGKYKSYYKGKYAYAKRSKSRKESAT